MLDTHTQTKAHLLYERGCLHGRADAIDDNTEPLCREYGIHACNVLSGRVRGTLQHQNAAPGDTGNASTVDHTHGLAESC